VNTALIIILIIVGFLLLIILLRQWFSELEQKTTPAKEIVAWLQEVGQRLEQANINTDTKLNSNMKMFNERLDKAALVIGQVQKTIGEFAEIGRSMQQLQEFLQSPKLRGNIGEQILKDLLIQYFPQSSYEFQYTFKSGEKVDAVIKTAQGLIPIDAKFPLENFRKKNFKEFNKDVKKHLQDIAVKYILPAENTVDYALMYIPSEAVYYEMINDQALFDLAGEKRVLPVSPMSFYAYMRAILMSFEGQKIQTQAKEILEILRSIKKDYEKTDASLTVLNKHLTNAYNQVAQVNKHLTQLGQKITSTHLLSQPATENKLLE
jgi:DNA recombination protein RmuC